jgi:hypothetical protein
VKQSDSGLTREQNQRYQKDDFKGKNQDDELVRAVLNNEKAEKKADHENVQDEKNKIDVFLVSYERVVHYEQQIDDESNGYQGDYNIHVLVQRPHPVVVRVIGENEVVGENDDQNREKLHE